MTIKTIISMFSIRKYLKSLPVTVYSLIASLFTYSYPMPTQGITIDYSTWEPYAQSLSQCAMGKFVLPNPTRIVDLTHQVNQVATLGPNVEETVVKQIHEAIVTYEIYGWDNHNRCIVNITEHHFDPNAPPMSAPYGLECHFTKDDIEKLVLSAQKLSKTPGNLPTYWVDPDSNVRGRACRSKVIEVPSVLPTPMRDTQQY